MDQYIDDVRKFIYPNNTYEPSAWRIPGHQDVLTTAEGVGPERAEAFRLAIREIQREAVEDWLDRVLAAARDEDEIALNRIADEMNHPLEHQSSSACYQAINELDDRKLFNGVREFCKRAQQVFADLELKGGRVVDEGKKVREQLAGLASELDQTPIPSTVQNVRERAKKLFSSFDKFVEPISHL